MTQAKSSGQGKTFVVDNEDEEESTANPTRESPLAPIGKFQTFTLDDFPPTKWQARFQEFKA